MIYGAQQKHSGFRHQVNCVPTELCKMLHLMGLRIRISLKIETLYCIQYFLFVYRQPEWAQLRTRTHCGVRILQFYSITQ